MNSPQVTIEDSKTSEMSEVLKELQDDRSPIIVNPTLLVSTFEHGSIEVRERVETDFIRHELDDLLNTLIEGGKGRLSAESVSKLDAAHKLLHGNAVDVRKYPVVPDFDIHDELVPRGYYRRTKDLTNLFKSMQFLQYVLFGSEYPLLVRLLEERGMNQYRSIQSFYADAGNETSSPFYATTLFKKRENPEGGLGRNLTDDAFADVNLLRYLSWMKESENRYGGVPGLLLEAYRGLLEEGSQNGLEPQLKALDNLSILASLVHESYKRILEREKFVYNDCSDISRTSKTDLPPVPIYLVSRPLFLERLSMAVDAQVRHYRKFDKTSQTDDILHISQIIEYMRDLSAEHEFSHMPIRLPKPVEAEINEDIRYGCMGGGDTRIVVDLGKVPTRGLTFIAGIGYPVVASEPVMNGYGKSVNLSVYQIWNRDVITDTQWKEMLESGYAKKDRIKLEDLARL